MGCDIHLFAEGRKKRSKLLCYLDVFSILKPPKWETLEKWEIDNDFEPPALQVLFENRFYTGGRNYNLFTALCGVRRKHFHGELPIISKPRGIPNDSCPEILAEVERMGSDGHSHNYNTLDELKGFNWEPYGYTCDDFRNEVIPKMEEFLSQYDDVRIVYFFDN